MSWDSVWHGLRPILVLLVASGLGAHAYYRHKRETGKPVSASKWMYWLYSAVFLVVAAISAAQACVRFVIVPGRDTDGTSALFALLIAISYMVVAVPTRKRRPLR